MSAVFERLKSSVFWAEVAAVWIVVYVLDRVYSVTGAEWFHGVNFWLVPLPLVLPLIPFLVAVVGPAGKALHARASHARQRRQAQSHYAQVRAEMGRHFSARGE